VTARLLEGKGAADEALTAVAARATALRDRGIVPKLVSLSVGSAAEADVYTRRLSRLGGRAGIEVEARRCDESVTAEGFGRILSELNEDDSVDSVVVQMPLPNHLSWRAVAETLAPRKDADGLTVTNSGRLYLDLPGPRPSTAAAMIALLDYAGVDLAGLHAVIMGRSNVVGHPVAEMALRRHATVTMTHTRTRNLADVTRQADVLFVGIGRAATVTGDMVKPGAIVVDAGINVTAGGIAGDVDLDSCLPVAGAITPVPGGVGPLTNVLLLRNVVESAEHRPG